MAYSKKTAANPASSLVLGAKELLATAIYSDITLVCGDKQFKAHRSILHPQSSVFRKLFSGNYKEDGQKTIQLDDDPTTFRVLLNFFYTFTYTDNSRPPTEPLSAFTIRIYAIADKYDVPPLRDLAAQKLRSVCQPATNLDDYISAIQTADELTNPKDTTLWEILIPKMIENIGVLLADPRSREVITETLNVSLLGHLARVHPDRCGVRQHQSAASPTQTGGDEDDDQDENGEGGEDGDDSASNSNGPVYGRGGRYLGTGRRLG
ncbi:hypothetical protein LTR36_002525 [Oleoguttula mirabilis]|uniref:BTB domain-containing protein n=1 Tax=Oleoguttula mirabilis TaxID=1507867 RepID=A0AAV9JL28_9PEZI|nr:hypothetical protein LTR36_002525 [Oleoguttula mirabilis]